MQGNLNLVYTLRLLRKTPVFTAVTFCIIAVGLSLYMGANTMATTIVDKPLPFPDGDRYVTLKTTTNNIESGVHNHDLYTFNELKNTSSNYSTLGAFRINSFVFIDGDYARSYQGAAISDELVSAMGVVPLLGRVFEPADSIQGAEKVALIGHTVWQDYYGSSLDIIGQPSLINGETYIIVGVMPAEFQFPMAESVWFPLAAPAAVLPGEGEAVSIVGILESRANLTEATVEIDSLIARLAEDYPEFYANRSEAVAAYVSIMTDSRIALGTMLNVITLCILALMIINLSSLLFIRSAARQHELAVRSSVGAVGWHLAKQVLAESFLICCGGLLIGIVLTLLILDFLQTGLLNTLPFVTFWQTMDFDLSTLAAGVIATLVTWLASGLFVAYRAYRTDSATILGSGDKVGTRLSENVMIRVIVTAEVILSCFLLVCGGAVIYLVNQFSQADYGVSTENYLIAAVSLSAPGYDNPQERQRYQRDLKDRLIEIPGVTAATFTTTPPGLSGQTGNYDLDDRDLNINDQLPAQGTIWISEDYFNDLDVALLDGREFEVTDTADTEPVVVINDVMARQLWGDESALGRRIQAISNGQREWLTIVGVIPRIVQNVYGNDLPTLYRPVTQNQAGDFFLMVKHQDEMDLLALEESIKVAAANVDREIPLERFRTLDRELYLSQGGVDLFADMFSGFSVATLLLAAIGIYSIIARTITQRTRDIGVRRALGSSNSKIILRFVRQGSYFLTAGIVVGTVPACLIIVPFIAGNFGGNAFVFLPGVVAAVIAVMTFLVVISCYLPARRAVALEPGDALRYE